jgi:hypothetical protein
MSMAEVLRMTSESARIFVFFPRFDKPGSGRERSMTCLDSSDHRAADILLASYKGGAPAIADVLGGPALPTTCGRDVNAAPKLSLDVWSMKPPNVYMKRRNCERA